MAKRDYYDVLDSMSSLSSVLTAPSSSAIDGAITELEEAVKTDDKEDIESKTQKLTEASSSLAQRMYAEAQAAASPDDGPDVAADGGDADAVDAEFEEVQEDKQDESGR